MLRPIFTASLALVLASALACGEEPRKKKNNDDDDDGNDTATTQNFGAGGSVSGPGSGAGQASGGGDGLGGEGGALTGSGVGGSGGVPVGTGPAPGSGGDGTTVTGTGGAGGAPVGWTCDASYYGAADGCDCGCGVMDPDCPNATVGVCTYCQDTGACSAAACPSNINPTNNAICN